MHNFSADYSEIISEPAKPNFIKDYLDKTLPMSKSDLRKKIRVKPKEIMYETLPPLDHDPYLTRHRSNIIKSRISEDKSNPPKLENSRDVSCFLDSKLVSSIEKIQNKMHDELLVSLGVKDSSPIFSLPTDLVELKKQITQADLLLWTLNTTKYINISDFASDFVKGGILKKPQGLSLDDLGGPSSRKEVKMLSNWLNFMLQKILENTNLTKGEMFENAQIIYTMCLREIVRQIKVHCADRGELLERVWKTYFSIMIKTINIYQKSKILQQKRFETETTSIKDRYNKEIVELEQKIVTRDQTIKALNEEISDLTNKWKTSTIKCEELKHRIIVLQQQYSKDKVRLIRLEDDYRNLKEVQKIVLEEMDDNMPGIKKVQTKSKIRFRELSKLFLSDPLCGDLAQVNLPDNAEADFNALIELDKIDLENKMKMHEIQGKIEETAEELIDVALDTKDLVNSVDVTTITELEDFVEPPVDSYIEEHLPPDIRILESILIEKIKNETWNNDEIDNYFGKNFVEEEFKSFDLQIEVENPEEMHTDIFKGFRSEKQKNTLKTLVKKITMNVIGQNKKKIASFKSGYDEMIQKRKYDKYETLRLRKQIFLTYKENVKLKEENEQLKEQINKFLISNKRRNQFKRVVHETRKRTTVVKEFKLNQRVVLFKKDTVSPAEDIFRKALINKEPKSKVSIRSITLLKLINTIIQDYNMQMKEEQIVQTQPLHIYAYDHFVAKHGGLKKVLETKYKQFLSACYFHKNIPQIGLFARFLGLCDPLEIEFFRTFVLTVDLLHKYSKLGVEINVSETDDPLIPTIRCFEVLNEYFHDKFSESELVLIKNDLGKITKPCPKCINQGVVEKTEFALFVIQHYKNFLKLSTNNVKDLFDAADLNGDKFLQFEEFDLLFRNIESEKYAYELSINCFQSYSDLIAEMNGQSYPAISYERFTIFALEKDYFKKEAQEKFIGNIDANELQRRMQILHNRCSYIIKEMKWRSMQCGKNSPSFIEMINTVKKKIEENDQRRPVYMAYKLLNEDTKIQVVDNTIRRYLPSIVTFHSHLKPMILRKKIEITMLKRQITWKRSMESVEDWEDRDLKDIKESEEKSYRN